MPRYIDAVAVVADILKERDKIPHTVPAAQYELISEKPYQHGNSMRGGIRKALRCIEQAKTIDAVEVVRCRDCKNWKHLDHLGCTDFVKLCKCGGYMVGANGYCVYGERKEGAER